jgi:tetratricopeptide (TPR) repeat protein
LFQRDQNDSKKNANIKHWLVKSGDKILGPFTYDEVAEKLRSKELVSIDEVVTPQSRWRVIRDEPAYKDVVEEVRRAQMSTREDTEIQGSTSQTHTVTQTAIQTASQSGTQTDPNAVASDLPVQADHFHFDQSQVQDADFVDHDTASAGVEDVSRSVSSKRNIRKYGVSGNDRQHRGQSKFVWFIWFVAAAIALSAVVLVMRSQTQLSQHAGALSDDFETLKLQANAAWSRGEFKNALSLYEKANLQQENRPEIVARLAPLLIQLQSGGGEAKRLLDETLNANSVGNTASSEKKLSNQQLGELETGLGLAALSGEDFVEAEARFKIAVSHSPKLFTARFDLAMVSYLAKSYTEAARRFGDAGDEAAALYMKARSLLGGDRSRSQEAEAVLERASSRFFDYRQEAFVLLASLDLESGDPKSAATRLRSALDTDPELTKDHWHDPLLYAQPLGWRDLVPRCQRLSDELKTSSARALLALCLFKAGDTDEAQRLIAEALGQWPEEPILEAVSAAMLTMSGRPGDARAALRIATAKPTDLPVLALITRGRVCATSGDMKCAEQTWRQLLDQKQAVLTALAGLADTAEASGDSNKAIGFAKRAKDLSPRYRPVMLFKKGGT